MVPVRPGEHGGPTKDQVRGKAWRRSSQGLYVPAIADATSAEQRIVEAAAALPAGAAVTGWASLRWRRGRWFDGSAGREMLPVPVALGDNRRISPRPGWQLSEEWLADGDVEWVDGVPVTRAERAIAFAMRHARGLRSAVVAMDMAAFDDLASIDATCDYAVEHLIGRRNVKLFWRAVDLADENSWSRPETLMRLVWTLDAGCPRPLCNVPIFDRGGRHLMTPDLFDPEAGVAGEYDGAIHLETAVRSRDLDREARFRDHGIELVTMMSTDRADTTRFIGRLLRAYGRARRRPVAGSWSLEPPPWWVDTSTVIARRALTESERSVWLKRQVA